MPPYTKIRMHNDKVLGRGSPTKILARECDWDRVVASADDISADLYGAIACRKEWCWRVRGWGPNSSEFPGLCKVDNGPGTPGFLGDSDDPYFGKVGCDSGAHYSFYPLGNQYYTDGAVINDPTYFNFLEATWFAVFNHESTGAHAMVCINIGNEIIWKRDINNDPLYHNGAAIALTIGKVHSGGIGGESGYTMSKKLDWGFTLGQLLGAHCNMEGWDIPEDEFGSPSEPIGICPYCRASDGSSLLADIW